MSIRECPRARVGEEEEEEEEKEEEAGGRVGVSTDITPSAGRSSWTSARQVVEGEESHHGSIGNIKCQRTNPSLPNRANRAYLVLPQWLSITTYLHHAVEFQ